MQHSPFDLDDDTGYMAWREHKLDTAPCTLDELLVEVNDPRKLSDPEYDALMARCRKANMAIYVSTLGETEGTDIPR
ncbi:MAG TPA: taurine catabolism dioxygenase TauD, partial [Gammaproteobacteria bacterium]|nr:taurine catabolism dioxygenase TauD [Gammaproteobacteria bacterium]